MDERDAGIRSARKGKERIMAEKSIIIIGAGLAGLSAGCYCQMNGYRTRIFEHHKAGGVAAAWKRKDYLVEGGIHFLMCHKPGTSIYEVYRELGTARANKFPDMTNYCQFIDEASGRKVSFVQDIDKVEAGILTAYFSVFLIILQSLPLRAKL